MEVVWVRPGKGMVKARGELALALLKVGKLKMSKVPAWGTAYPPRSRWGWAQWSSSS